jgi:putative flippase GtrA
VKKAALVRQLIAYYGVALVNTAFGYSVYALLLFLGVNLFVAQVVSYCLGVTFNYFMYRRHVFRDADPAIVRFVLAYAVNYGVNLAFLAVLHAVIRSDYLSGLAASIAASLVNFVALKLVVFRRGARHRGAELGAIPER